MSRPAVDDTMTASIPYQSPTGIHTLRRLLIPR
jgi:hypothetical protein